MPIYAYIPSFGFYQLILWWILVAAILILAGGWAFEVVSRPFQTKSPLEILRRRYAKGQINKKEYEERKKVLSII